MENVTEVAHVRELSREAETAKEQQHAEPHAHDAKDVCGAALDAHARADRHSGSPSAEERDCDGLAAVLADDHSGDDSSRLDVVVEVNRCVVERSLEA